jgi:tetratricopeptide (TPR) repeat protein
LNFIEPETDGTGLTVSRSTSRRSKALWNILTQSGLRTNVVGWYATHPAEPIAGAIVSNLFQESQPAAPGDPWPAIPGAVHPAALAEAVFQSRLHPGELTVEEMFALLPGLPQMRRDDPRPRRLAKIVAQCASVHNAATTLLGSKEPWDCAMVFYEMIDVAGHHFMQYYPPRMSHVAEADFAFYREVMPRVYQLQDAMLGTLLDLVGPDTTVVLLSDHGFHSDHLRPRVQAALDDPHAAMDASWHRPLGMLVMSGPGIKRGAEVHGANLLDIAPTALTLLGLPVGGDMDGRVLVEGLDRPVEVERNFGWDSVEGEAGQHPADLRVDPFEARDAMKQLADLGYVSEPSGDAKAQLALCDQETRFNLGVVYMTTGRQREALRVFEGLHRERPDEPRYTLNLAHCLSVGGRLAACVQVLEGLIAAYPDNPEIQLLRGAALFGQGRIEDAAAALEIAAKTSPDRPDLLCTMAEAYTRLKRWDEAEAVLRRAAAIDPHDPEVHHKRALLSLARERFEEAAEHALEAVSLRHFFPAAHYTLGVALTWMKDYDHAIQSFKVALSMQPGLIDAHRYVASIHRLREDRHSARPHRDAAERLLKARSQGETAPEALVRDVPMGPQDWAKRVGIGQED